MVDTLDHRLAEVKVETLSDTLAYLEDKVLVDKLAERLAVRMVDAPGNTIAKVKAEALVNALAYMTSHTEITVLKKELSSFLKPPLEMVRGVISLSIWWGSRLSLKPQYFVICWHQVDYSFAL